MLFFALETASRAAKARVRIEDDLIIRVGQGDTDAFYELYIQARTPVYGFALSLTKNRVDAEDIMQDTFIRVRAAAHKYQPRGMGLSWILTITRNLALNLLANRARTSELSEELPWQSPESTEDRAVLDAALHILDDIERQIVTLHLVSGFKHRETAKLLELPLNTILSKYSRALKKLKSYLTEEGIE